MHSLIVHCTVAAARQLQSGVAEWRSSPNVLELVSSLLNGDEVVNILTVDMVT
jgi:hypothetical protein